MRPLLCCILSVKHECKIKMNVCQTDPLYKDVATGKSFFDYLYKSGCLPEHSVL